MTLGWAREVLECAQWGLGASQAGKGQEGVKSVEGPSEGWGAGWDMLGGSRQEGRKLWGTGGWRRLLLPGRG